MAYYYPNVDPVYLFQRKGTPDDPYIDLTENEIVSNGFVTLKELPYFTTKVTVKKSDGTTLTEVTTDTLTVSQYRVDYSIGIVYFNSSMNNQNLTFLYRGTGMLSFPASRIWIDSNTGSSIMSLQEMITTMDNSVTNINTAIDNANTAAQDVSVAINNANTATTNANTATTNANSAATYANTEGDYAKSKGDEALSASTTANNLNTTVQTAEDARVLAETSRVNTENIRVSAEDTRKTNETSRQNAETTRVTNENDRISAEDNRVIAESARVSAENDRVTAENTRTTNDATWNANETTRQNQESTRQTNESARMTAEDSRVTTENARVTAENDRVNAENTRQINETTRQNQESTRELNETDRGTAESSRVTAETGRVDAESARVTAEDTRVSQENSRISAESDRVIAENTRVTAESTRESNELQRQTDTTTAIGNANTATSNANTAATNANDKATLAQNKVDSLTTLEANINQSITDAQTATTNANTATTSANDAATYATAQGDYAKTEGDYAKQQGDAAKAVVDGTGLIPTTQKGQADGVATLDSNAKIPLSQLPDAAMQQNFVVATMTDRDALTGLKIGDRVIVMDAGDGSREGYIWDGTQYLKDSDTDWANVNIDWANIINKPTEFTPSAHTHNATDIIEDTNHRFVNDTEKTKLSNITDDANHVTSSTTNGNILIDGTETNVYTHPINHPASIITQDSNNRFVSDTQTTSWDNKYDKPVNGIPKTDLETTVQDSLGKADSAVQSIPTASTTQAGIVELYDNTDSTDATKAATANAVKIAYDKANSAIPSTEKGVLNGVATLGADGLVPSSQLPSLGGTASGTSITDSGNYYTSTDVEGALQESAQNLSSHKADTATNAHLGKNIGVEDTAGNFTGTDVESVLAELFTFANDGKTQVANAVTAKGVSASPSDTFSALATKIGQINTGKKFASGSYTSTASQVLFNGSDYLYKSPVQTLDFTPSVIVIFSSLANEAAAFIGTNDMNGSSGGIQNYFFVKGQPYNAHNPGTVATTNNTANFYVYNNAFVLGTYGQGSYNWIAYE